MQPMASARTRCPSCNRPDVVDLADLLYSPRIDYFRCYECGCGWLVPKGEDDRPLALSSETRGPCRCAPRTYRIRQTYAAHYSSEGWSKPPRVVTSPPVRRLRP